MSSPISDRDHTLRARQRRKGWQAIWHDRLRHAEAVGNACALLLPFRRAVTLSLGRRVQLVTWYYRVAFPRECIEIVREYE